MPSTSRSFEPPPARRHERAGDGLNELYRLRDYYASSTTWSREGPAWCARQTRGGTSVRLSSSSW